MRLTAAILAGLALLTGLYVAGPYWTVLHLADALATRDVETVASIVNLTAVRNSFAKQLVAGGLKGTDLEALEPAQASLAAGTAALAIVPVLDRVVKAETIESIVTRETGRPNVLATLSPLARIMAVVRVARWRGFRNVSLAVPPDGTIDRQVRIQFRFSRLRWRLVSIDLPQAARRRLAADVARALGLDLREAPKP